MRFKSATMQYVPKRGIQRKQNIQMSFNSKHLLNKFWYVLLSSPDTETRPNAWLRYQGAAVGTIRPPSEPIVDTFTRRTDEARIGATIHPRNLRLGVMVFLMNDVKMYFGGIIPSEKNPSLSPHIFCSSNNMIGIPVGRALYGCVIGADERSRLGTR